ncbi:MAG: DUF423 domain-containing protein [Candidatus Eisenbacteria bacterium]|uniref:DUF423 domain-containing protein n=1 Tax=Eiseniibacteriota bacterium TaxID=2212470 RepID=A0A849SRP1_UNCEI|nr:DUF423 domain-containing protein [Candidatus Eisenbacteria bacterium]
MTPPRANASGLLGVLGAASGFLAVAAGAFGAHALRDRVTPEHLAVFETAARYQLFHALALLLLALTWRHGAGRGERAFASAGALFVAGQLLFPGSLYALVLSGVRGWGAVTPLGGLCYLAGWVAFGVGWWRSR